MIDSEKLPSLSLGLEPSCKSTAQYRGCTTLPSAMSRTAVKKGQDQDGVALKHHSGVGFLPEENRLLPAELMEPSVCVPCALGSTLFSRFVKLKKKLTGSQPERPIFRSTRKNSTDRYVYLQDRAFELGRNNEDEAQNRHAQPHSTYEEANTLLVFNRGQSIFLRRAMEQQCYCDARRTCCKAGAFATIVVLGSLKRHRISAAEVALCVTV